MIIVWVIVIWILSILLVGAIVSATLYCVANLIEMIILKKRFGKDWKQYK